MGRKRRQRRQPHGSAWHWKQTDCWYYTQPGTRKRIPLFDEDGNRIRGLKGKEAADLALAKERLAWEVESTDAVSGGVLLVVQACSDYLQYCERGLKNGTISPGHQLNASSWLNDLCEYCGALPVMQLRKAHIRTWIENHSTWRSAATQRSVISVVQAALNRAGEMRGVANPLKGYKKPRAQPRLHSLSAEDEQLIYEATEVCFRNFLFAAIHTGLRPFCELARITADDVEENDRGVMWRVYSSKTKKSRKIPVRPVVAELTRELMVTAPRRSGIPLFRNTRGKPWKRANGVVRFIAIKKKLGWDQDSEKSRYSCYTCRHTFAHRMLSGYWNDGVGCSIETLAELMGDTPKVAFDHYGKEWGQHYQEPLWAAIGETANSPRRKQDNRSTPKKNVKPAQNASSSGRKKKHATKGVRRRSDRAS